MISNIIWALLLCSGPVLTQSYEDKRCRCVCSNPAVVLNDTMSTNRQLYISNVPPDKCNCEMAVLPHIGIDIRGRELELCPRCECKYEMRNTRVIMIEYLVILVLWFLMKIVVILVLWLLMLLSSYMAFVMCLDPLMRRKKKLIFDRYRDDKDATEEACNLLAQDETEE